MIYEVDLWELFNKILIYFYIQYLNFLQLLLKINIIKEYLYFLN